MFYSVCLIAAVQIAAGLVLLIALVLPAVVRPVCLVKLAGLVVFQEIKRVADPKKAAAVLY